MGCRKQGTTPHYHMSIIVLTLTLWTPWLHYHFPSVSILRRSMLSFSVQGTLLDCTHGDRDTAPWMKQKKTYTVELLPRPLLLPGHLGPYFILPSIAGLIGGDQAKERLADCFLRLDRQAEASPVVT